MNILVVRFRQMGDAILTTATLNTLRRTFPDARIDFVLNDRLKALFEGHPSVTNIITFTEQERHSATTYIKKVWRTVHQTRYDIIIDMRSTANTMLFALFSRRSPWRIGLKKPYTWAAFNHRVTPCGDDESMVSHNLKMLAPLSATYTLQYVNEFTLHPTADELSRFRTYMQQQGIDFNRPVILAGVATRVAGKAWSEQGMVWVLRRLIDRYPQVQLIINYAPGAEQQSAQHIYEQLGRPRQIFFDIKADSQRELMAMASNISMYFGNEGGARHIVHAMGRPSLVVCAPTSRSATWIPQNAVPAEAIDPHDMTDNDTWGTLTYEQRFALVQKETVWQRLDEFINKHHIT